MFAAVGLAWFGAEAAVRLRRARAEARETRKIIRYYADDHRIGPRLIEQLGGPDAAIEKIDRCLRLVDCRYDRRRAAAWMLAECGGERAVAPLIRLLDDQKPRVREAAAQALGNLGDPAAFEHLLAAVDDGDRTVRRAAAYSLGGLKDRRAVKPLIVLLAHPDSDVRLAAVQALRALKAGEAAGPLSAALEDKSWSVRYTAARALMHIGNSRAIEPLRARTEDENTWVRVTAAIALWNLRDRKSLSVVGAALADEDTREDARAVLVELGEASVEPLLVVLQDEGWQVREIAARALGSIGDERALGALRAQLKSEHKELRKTAAWAIKMVENPPKWEDEMEGPARSRRGNSSEGNEP